MKNFSAKNVQFTNLSISGEAPVSQGDIGTAPNQIPLNKDLGSLAYMNAPQIEDLNVDTLELREIAAELSDTAVDVFVYDTRRDSDGGAWRSRTSHTSWYNEELNTATRGGRREFPAVAVIVAETNKVTIYDGDDPDLPMWMVFNRGSGTDIASNFSHVGPSNVSLSSIYAVNSQICIAGDFGSDMLLFQVKLINDHTIGWFTNSARLSSTDISKRNTGTSFTNTINSVGVVSTVINDVAMTVLPNAPIDDNTGLPIPTIAVATDSGVSVIRNDGSVESNGNFGKIEKVTIDNKHNLYIFRDMLEDYVVSYGFVENKISNFTTEIGVYSFRNGRFHTSLTTNQFNLNSTRSDVVSGQDYGLLKVDTMAGNFDEELFSYITSEYNTGWMPGDTKLAALSDTKNETVGVDETTELVTNGGFDADSDWTKGTGWTINGGVATKTGSDNTSILQDIDTIPGKNYVVSLDIVSGTGNSGAKLYVGGVLVLDGLKDAQSISVDFVATNDSTTIAINGGSFDGGSIDNISVKQTGELVTNGTFDNGTEGWSSVLNATLSNDANRIKVDGTSNFATALQSITGLVSGKKYTISLELIAGTSTKPYFTTNNTGGANQISNNFDFGFQSHTFTSNGETLELRLVNSSEGSGYAFFDNVSVRLAEEDRSVNDNGLQIFGEIDKTPVAPGADLVAYSGFSANNYLMQPYNSDLDFGTGDFCVMGWFNTQQTSSNEYDDLLSIGDLGAVGYGAWSEGGLLIQNRTDNNRFLSYLGTPSGQVNVSLPQPYYTPNAWNHFIIKREAGLVSVFLNGVQEGASVEYYYNFARNNNPNWKFTIGYSGDNYVYPANNSKLALFRISATAPTAEQIAKIYRDEKPLFQDGAQATLYGTSDAVTALAYDDSDNLLHVGTASGRSTFNGLKRVDNTTTAVSTAISATEGLVIEQ